MSLLTVLPIPYHTIKNGDIRSLNCRFRCKLMVVIEWRYGVLTSPSGFFIQIDHIVELW